MNNWTLFALLAILSTVSTLTMSSAYAGVAYPGVGNDAKESANEMMLNNIPISIWTDQTSYERNNMIKVTGQVANWSTEIPVTLTVTNPLNAIVAADQINVDENGKFETMIRTTGDLWKYNGIYVIKVNYGSDGKTNKILVELTGGVSQIPKPEMPPKDDNCVMVNVPDDVDCVPFKIKGGMVTGASVNAEDNILVIHIDAKDDGKLMLNPSQSVIQGIFMVLVNDEEWDDVEINGNEVTVMFPAGTEKIELIGSWVIPEFGTIAVMILVVAIISIIAITSRSRLSIIPRY